MNLISDTAGELAALRQQRAGRRLRFASISGILAVIIVAGTVFWFWRTPAAPAAPPPPVVSVAPPLQRQVLEWDTFVGRFAPSQTVEIRPRVSGAVTEIHFRDGDMVQKDQLLFIIDPRPFVAALNEAKANVAVARSAVALARSDLARASRLTGDEAVSGSEIDSLRARVESAEASLGAAQARQDAKALDVEFTEVRAPIAGRVSDRRVDVGNLVTGGETGNATLLTTVNALDPIYFTFDRSEALYLKAQRVRQQGGPPPVAEIRLQDEADYHWKGTLDFTDNGLNNHSGTIRGRAILANPGYFLTPGMFGNMRLADGETHSVLLVPDVAVVTDQARQVVLTVDDHDTIASVPVETGPLIEGLRIIRSGLSPSARVVVGGMAYALPGTQVHAQPGDIKLQPGTADALASPVSADATFADK